MTNTLNTPAEVVEMNYPLRIERYQRREGSGGEGRNRGGDGLTREFRFLEQAEVTLLTERRAQMPWGLAGGQSGAAGANWLDGQALGGKAKLTVHAGQVLRIETPGGGGWGHPSSDPAPDVGE